MHARLSIKITPADVGERVSVRSRIPAGPGEPGHTDTIGYLRSWSDGRLCIERRDGERVALAETDVVGARALGPEPQRRSRRLPQQMTGEPGSAPHAEVAPHTHPVELARLALEEAQHPDCDPLTVQVAIWLVRASNAVVVTATDNLRELDLSVSAFNVLMTLRNTPGGVLEPKDIAVRLLITGPSVTGLLDTLERKRLVERQPHPSDQRRRLIQLTPEARDVLRDNLTAHYADLAGMLKALSSTERKQLVGLLRRVGGATPPMFDDSE